MSMDDLAWRRSLYLATGLSTTSLAIIIFFIIPFLNNNPGLHKSPGWIFSGIQLILISAILSVAFRNKREGCLTRAMLVFAGVVSILSGLLLILSITDVHGLGSFRTGVAVISIVNIITGILTLRACI